MTKKQQVLLLYSSSVIGLIIGMLNSVINTRNLNPLEYGDVRYVQNIIAFVSSMLLLGYFVSGSRLLALSKDEVYSRRIRGVMCTILAISILVLMIVQVAYYFYNSFQGNHIADLFLASIPVCGNVVMLNYINTTAQGDNHIVRISIARLLPSTLYLFVAYWIFKEYGATPIKMLLLFNGISVITLFLIILSTRPSFKHFGESFKILHEENKKYGFNVYVGSVANVSTAYIAGITLGAFQENNVDVGFYTLALTLAHPLAMLPSIVGTTYFKKFATQDKIDKKVMTSSLGITILSCIVFILSIKYIVLFLYDESYSFVSIIASYLAIGISIHGLGDMINRFLGAHGLGKELRNAALGSGAILVLGNIILIYYWGITGAIITKILSSFAYFGILYYYYVNFRRCSSK